MGRSRPRKFSYHRMFWLTLFIAFFVSSWLTFTHAHSQSKINFPDIDGAPVCGIWPAPAVVRYLADMVNMLAFGLLFTLALFYWLLVRIIGRKPVRVFYKGVSVMIQAVVATFPQTSYHWMLVYALFSAGVICEMRFFSLLYSNEKFLGIINVILSLFIGNFLPLIYYCKVPDMVAVGIPLLAATVALWPHRKRLILSFKREFLKKTGWGNQNTSGNGQGGTGDGGRSGNGEGGRNSGGRGSQADA